MSKTKILLLLAIGVLSSTTQVLAQTTNPPPATALETIETATGILVLRSSMPIGTVNTGSDVISVTCKQDNIVNPAQNTQRSFYGCSLTISANGQTMAKTLIDGDEMNSLLQAVDNIRNVSWSVTALPSFNLSYTTKAGLTIAGFSSKRNGAIEFSIRSNTMERSVILTVDQVGQLYSILQDTKTKIDALRKG